MGKPKDTFSDYSEKGATISRNGRYRYDLVRRWDGLIKRPDSTVLFIGLNPSTANARQDDPTIRRCVTFARLWGFGGLVMCNLFAYRATNPDEMLRLPRRHGMGCFNDRTIIGHAERAARIVLCWGAHGEHRKRGADVRRSMLFVRDYEQKVMQFGQCANGEPKHPLYLRGDTELKPVWGVAA
jgi:hypothetical protein